MHAREQTLEVVGSIPTPSFQETIPMPLSTPQLCLLRCLKTRDMEATLLPILLRRCGASEVEWDALLGQGTVEDRKGRIAVTEAGQKTYKKAKIGRMF